MEEERKLADIDLVALGEHLPLRHRPAVQQRAVAAVQVLDVEVAVEVDDAGVLAADGARFEHDVAGGMPAEDDGLAPSRGIIDPG